jgi:RNA polymerase sigma-70 factor (ECF subfamily)
MSIEELLRRCLRGEEVAIQQLFERYKDYVFRVAWLMLGDQQDAEDATQETFEAVFRALHGYRGDAAFESWLHQIALNRCRSKLRRKQLVRIPWLKVVEEPADHTADAQPEALALAREERREILSAVRSLPVRLREVVVLFYYREYSCAEVAQIIGISEGSVRVRLHRARQQLEAKLRSTGLAWEPPLAMEQSNL